MFARRPVFPGKNAQHSLKLIVQGLGPWKEESSLSWIKQPEVREFVESLTPAVDRKSFCESLGSVSPSAMELLDALLQFDPEHRVSAEQALSWSFFGEDTDTDLRCPEDEPVCTPLKLSDFEFLRRKIDLPALREEIFLEALHYHPELEQRYLREQSRMGTMYEIGKYELLAPGEIWHCPDAAVDAVE